MARRKRAFDLVRDDLDEEPREYAVRRNQSEIKKYRKRKEAMALALAALPNATMRRLPLDPVIHDAIENLANTAPTPARRRQLLRVIGLLRDVDLDMLDAALAGDSPHDAYLRKLERWRKRMVEGDDAEVHAFFDAHPGGDLQQLRQVSRIARGEGPKAIKAFKKLFVLMKDAGPPIDDAVDGATVNYGEE